jgi:quinol monooxygenase YgiN
MKKLITGAVIMATAIVGFAGEQMSVSTNGMANCLVRIAEIEAYPEHLEAYLAAAKTVGAESVAKEPGVVCIFPMQKKEHPTQIRIVEIYRDEAAYKAHLETPHFKKYKSGTLHMVKSLHLAPMEPLDPVNMGLIFKKGNSK